MRQTISGFILVFAFAGASLFGATGTIERLTGQAEVIVVGTIVEGTQNGEQVYFSLRPDRVLKGTLPLGVPTPILWQSPVVQAGEPFKFPKLHGLWFLGETEGAFRRLLPGSTVIPFTYYPAPLDPPSGEFSYSADTRIVEKIALELCAAASRFSGDEKVAAIVLRAFRSLYGLDSPKIRRAYRLLSASRDRDTAAIGLGSLVRLGDVSAIEETSARAAELQVSKSFSFLVTAVGDSVPVEPSAARAMGRLALARTAALELQKAAAYSLRAAHTAAAMPYLGRLLDHADSDVRQLAVAGISAYLRNLPPMTADNSATMAWKTPAGAKRYDDREIAENLRFGSRIEDVADRNRTLSFWRTWWRRNSFQFPEE